MSHLSSIDKTEIEHFAKDSKRWWDKNGPFKPLHKINTARLTYIKQQICDFYGKKNSLKGLNILDIGCGGGLISEPLARLGANITGLDADPQAIETAKEHAKTENLKITYLNEDLRNIKRQYDVVLAMEILEHVSDIPIFIEQCTKALKPGGLLIFSTLNRTAKSFALGIMAAEYILRWVPKGTHSWKKFVKPSELTRHARSHTLKAIQISGLIYNPLKDEFSLSENDTDVNYLMSFTTNT